MYRLRIEQAYARTIDPVAMATKVELQFHTIFLEKWIYNSHTTPKCDLIVISTYLTASGNITKHSTLFCGLTST